MDPRSLEAAALAALPALRTVSCHGWQVRFADGFSRRANSVAALDEDAGAPPLAERIARCEATYAEAGLPCRFKIHPAVRPPDLDPALAARGYRRDAETLVLSLDLTGDAPVPGGDPPSIAGSISTAPQTATQMRSATLAAFVGVPVELHDAPTAAWLQTWAALSERQHQAPVFAALVRAITHPSAYALVHDRDAAVASARVTLVDGIAALNDLMVAPSHRRRGLATALTRARLDWARQRGAHEAFMQVVAGNAVERAVAARLGFVEAYRYWYRES